MHRASRRLLIPTDFSEGAACARRTGRRLAARLGAEVHLLHVSTGPVLGHDPFHPCEAPGPTASAAAGEPPGCATRWMDLPPKGAASGRGEEMEEVRVVRKARAPADGILAYAEEQAVDLIVMGTHGRTGLRRLAEGSVAEAVLRRACRPVVTVRQDIAAGRPLARRPTRRLLVPVDFSEASPSVIGHARLLAQATGAAMDLLHVVQAPRPAPLAGRFARFAASVPRVATRARRDLEALAERTPGPDVETRFCVLVGDPAASTVAFAQAQRAGLVVMGTHGRSGLRRLAMGSVAEEVVRRAPCAVMTLRAYGHSLAGAPPEEDAFPEENAPLEENASVEEHVLPEREDAQHAKRGGPRTQARLLRRSTPLPAPPAQA